MTLYFVCILEYSLGEKFTICGWIYFRFGGIHTINRWCL